MGERARVVFCVVSLSACVGPPPGGATKQAKIVLGEDNRVVVDDDGTNVPEKYRRLLDAFGVLYLDDTGACTATHLGGGLVVTAGHCFGAGPEAMKNVPAGTGSVRWGVRGTRNATWNYLTSTPTTLLDARREKPGVDYAFFLVDPVPPVAVEVNLTTRPKEGTTLTLFSHPYALPLKWSRTCTLLPSDDDGGPQRFDHKCNTETGSSGGVMLDDETLRVVGIHDSDNGTDTQPGTINQATYILDTPLADYLQPRP